MSSRRRLRRISCTEKQSYETADLAAQACRSVLRNTGERLHVYKCRRFCHRYHVGHLTRGARQAMEAAWAAA